MYSEICVCEREIGLSLGFALTQLIKKVGEITLATVEARAHFTIFLFLSMFDVFCNLFLKNEILDFKKNRTSFQHVL